jgi:hypothetical protein
MKIFEFFLKYMGKKVVAKSKMFYKLEPEPELLNTDLLFGCREIVWGGGGGGGRRHMDSIII